MQWQRFRTLARLVALSLVLASATAWAQLTVQANGFSLPEERAEILYRTTLRVVAQEFRLRDSSRTEIPITLLLGDPNEGVSGDELRKVYVIYMERWDDAKFALAVSRIAVQHLLSEERKTKIVSEVLRRADSATPISVQALSRPRPGRNEQPIDPPVLPTQR